MVIIYETLGVRICMYNQRSILYYNRGLLHKGHTY